MCDHYLLIHLLILIFFFLVSVNIYLFKHLFIAGFNYSFVENVRYLVVLAFAVFLIFDLFVYLVMRVTLHYLLDFIY